MWLPTSKWTLTETREMDECRSTMNHMEMGIDRWWNWYSSVRPSCSSQCRHSPNLALIFTESFFFLAHSPAFISFADRTWTWIHQHGLMHELGEDLFSSFYKKRTLQIKRNKNRQRRTVDYDSNGALAQMNAGYSFQFLSLNLWDGFPTINKSCDFRENSNVQSTNEPARGIPLERSSDERERDREREEWHSAKVCFWHF